MGYVARCHSDKGREYLGYYDDPMQGYYAYKQAKEAYAKVLAEKFKNVLRKDAYLKLKDFKLTRVYPDPPPMCSNNLIK